jgi:preprotein translocase subunit SecE
VNRETKRLLQRQGQIDDEGNPAVGTRRQPPKVATQGGPRAFAERTRPVEFLREVRGELRRVAWPTRPQTLNSATVVLVAVVLLTAAIFGLDTAFSKFVLYLFKQ